MSDDYPSSSSSSGKHPLKSKWTVSYLPNLTEEILKAHNGNYDGAQKAVLKTLEDVTTIEALFSSINSLLDFSNQPQKDALIFARDGVYPAFASFPGGHRLWLMTNGVPNGKKTIEVVASLIMGESVRRVCNGEAAVHVVRIMHKPNARSQDGLHLDLWLDKKQHVEEVKKFILEQLTRVDVKPDVKDMAM